MRGFTLVELLVALAVLAILLMVAMPAFNNLIVSQRVKTASFDLVAGLSYARSEAVKQNGTVTLTPSGGNWANGWTVTGPDGSTLKTAAALQSVTVSGPTSLVYGRSGRITGGSGDIEIASSVTTDGVAARCISVDVTGLPRAKQGACS
ncbi:MAG: GspH/FimT family pseudopilin [Rhodocyclales bacterium]|nr:GspH/FimT family pseudopilin [Rhodocyclales bacterium]